MSDSITKEFNIGENSSKKFAGTIRFADSEIQFYTKIRVRATLFLGKRNQLNSPGTIIQTRNFDLQLAESFSLNKNADLFLIVNSSINRNEIESWRAFAMKYNSSMMLWNFSLYSGFSYNFKMENGDFAKNLKNKVVVVLNNPYKTDLNEFRRAIDFIPRQELLESGKTHKISTLFIGDKLNLGELLVPMASETVEKRGHKNLEEMIKRLTKDWIKELKKAKKLEKIQKKAKKEVLDDPFAKGSDTEAESSGQETKKTAPEVILRSTDCFSCYENLVIFGHFCCDAPVKADLIEEIKKIRLRMTELFPNNNFYFFYRFAPERAKEGCCRWKLGDVEIRNGLRSDTDNEGHFAHSQKINNNYNEPWDEFAIIKLLPFSRKLEWLVSNLYRPDNLSMISKAILSDLCEELEIYSRNSWSGLMEKKLLEGRMVILESFVKNEKLDLIMANEDAKICYMKVLIHYQYIVSKITHFYDYLWFNRNKRVVRGICEDKIEKFIKEHFKKEQVVIKNELRLLQNRKEKKDIAMFNLKNPFGNKIVLDQHGFFHENFMFDRVAAHQFNFHSRVPNITVDQNKFVDFETGTDYNDARKIALEHSKNNCYFDLPQFWTETSPVPVPGQTKEYSPQTWQARTHL